MFYKCIFFLNETGCFFADNVCYEKSDDCSTFSTAESCADTNNGAGGSGS
jgi:hypothetical protein